jgi:hypothetical protein
VQAAEFREHRQQVERGEFIGGNGQLALLDFAELDQGFLRVIAEVEEFFGVFLQGVACVGEDAFARGAIEEGFTDFFFEFADGLADRGLGAEEFSAAREKRPSRATVKKTSSWESSMVASLPSLRDWFGHS